MKERLILLDTAKLALEKGFDIPVQWFYDGWVNNELKKGNGLDNHNLYKAYSAPTQSLLQKWLREKHEINIDISTEYKGSGTVYHLDVVTKGENEFGITTGVSYENSNYLSYEDALEEGLQEALKQVKL